MWGYEKCVENDRLDKKRIVGLKGCILLIYSCGNCRLSTIPPLFYMTEGTENGKSDRKIVLKFDRKWKGRGGGNGARPLTYTPSDFPAETFRPNLEVNLQPSTCSSCLHARTLTPWIKRIRDEKFRRRNGLYQRTG